MQLQIFSPIEQEAFNIREDRNEFFATNFIVDYSKQVEIRVEVFTFPEDSIAMNNPHVKNGLRIGQLMNNVNDSQVAMHQLGSEDLEFFGADWATQALFSPKENFSLKSKCQLITLYKEEVGLVFVYLLFDSMEKYKDEWRYIIGFREEVEVAR